MNKIILIIFVCTLSSSYDTSYNTRHYNYKNVTKQHYDFTCGVATLSTILKYYYGKNISEKNIFNTILNTNKQQEILKKQKGFSFFDLSQYSKKVGFKPLALAVSIGTLKKLKIPAILYLNIKNSEHFTVYKGIDQKYVYLSDPSLGNIKIKIKTFKKIFYNNHGFKNMGNILAILPIDNSMVKINKNFMKIENVREITF